MLHKIVYKHFVVLFTFKPEIIRDLSSSNMVSIVSLELFCVTDNSVCDQSIKTLQECGSQMLMQKVNISQTKYLTTFIVIPATHTVQVLTSTQAVRDISEKSSHECEVVSIHWDESWHVVLILPINVYRILFVH